MGFNFRDDFHYEYRMQFPHQGICPEGWHIPSEEEFQQLLIIDASKLMASVGWDDYGLCGKHSDEYGFSALPIGGFQIYGSPHGYFDQSTTAYFWSTKQLGQEQTYVYVLRGSKGGCEANYIPLSKTDARAVRCVKD